MILKDLQPSRGTYIAVNPVNSTRALLADWLLDNPIPNPISPKEMHVSLLYSRTPIRPTLSTNEFHADAVKFKVFKDSNGLNALAVVLDAPEITQRHEHFIRLGATHDFPTYVPHLTVSYDIGDFNISDLELPYFHLLFCGEFARELRE